jgi:hypothetical protein
VFNRADLFIDHIDRKRFLDRPSQIMQIGSRAGCVLTLMSNHATSSLDQVDMGHIGALQG